MNADSQHVRHLFEARISKTDAYFNSEKEAQEFAQKHAKDITVEKHYWIPGMWEFLGNPEEVKKIKAALRQRSKDLDNEWFRNKGLPLPHKEKK